MDNPAITNPIVAMKKNKQEVHAQDVNGEFLYERDICEFTLPTGETLTGQIEDLGNDYRTEY